MLYVPELLDGDICTGYLPFGVDGEDWMLHASADVVLAGLGYLDVAGPDFLAANDNGVPCNAGHE